MIPYLLGFLIGLAFGFAAGVDWYGRKNGRKKAGSGGTGVAQEALPDCQVSGQEWHAPRGGRGHQFLQYVPPSDGLKGSDKLGT
jgi:hypothetical protein